MDENNDKVSTTNGSEDIKIDVIVESDSDDTEIRILALSDQVPALSDQVLASSTTDRVEALSDPVVASSDSEGAFDPEVCNQILASINEMIQTKSSFYLRCNIYKVPKNLRSVNPRAYIPQVISIGPFHYDNEDLKVMELHKLTYLNSFRRRANLNLENIVKQVMKWEERARNCYAEPIDMGSKEFVQLILMDGCFVVEYFIRRYYPKYQEEIDHIFRSRMYYDLFSDLIKLENQIPFFVLEGLFELYRSGDPFTSGMSFSQIFCFIADVTFDQQSKAKPHSPDHFVDILWTRFKIDLCLSDEKVNIVDDDNKIIQPPTATDFYDAGVKFKRAERGCGITFNNGVLKIPHIKISSDYETYLRNLIAFEQCYPVKYYASFFAIFMDSLINTDKDVNLLIKAGIITNYLGSNEDVSNLFNNISKHVNIGGKNDFDEVCDVMKKYCKVRRHRWMASLRRNYFNTPWASISFSAALILLILTLTQTIFSGLSIKK